MDGQQYLAYAAHPPPPPPPPPPGSVAWPGPPSASAQQHQPPPPTFFHDDGARADALAYDTRALPAFGDMYGGPHSHTALSGPAMPQTQQMALGLGSQLDPSTGPTRPRTRRQVARAQGMRSVSAPGLQQQPAPPDAYYAGSMSPPSLSRPQTPTGSSSRATPFSAPSHLADHISMSSGMSSSQSPPYPSTPVSTTSTASRYSFPFHHARSASGAPSIGTRSASPALSVRSALTSLSSASGMASGRMSPTYPGDKQKKTRLTNAQRRQICLWQQQNPTARQEDMAIIWGVERSTISKILKAKSRWLASSLEDDSKTARHKPSKFPEIERDMERWLQELHRTGKPSTSLSDQKIRQKAKDIARDQGIGEDKFKASSGWVENFKHRHNIRRGVWYGSTAPPGTSGAPAAVPAAMDEDEPPGADFFDNAPSYPAHLLYPAPLDTRAAVEDMQPAPMEQDYLPGEWKEQGSPNSGSGSPPVAPDFVHPPRFEQQGTPPETPTSAQHPHDPFPTPASAPRHPSRRIVSAPVGELPALASEVNFAAAPATYGYPRGALPALPTPPSASPPGPDGAVTPIPPAGTISDARKNLVALLEFFDAQPADALITAQDREALAAITCKLHGR